MSERKQHRLPENLSREGRVTELLGQCDEALAFGSF